jgi:hypothetical protein
MGCYVDSIADGVLAGGVCLIGHQPGTILGKEFQNLPSRQEKH